MKVKTNSNAFFLFSVREIQKSDCNPSCHIRRDTNLVPIFPEAYMASYAINLYNFDLEYV